MRILKFLITTKIILSSILLCNSQTAQDKYSIQYLEKNYLRESYKIKTLIANILADNEDTYIAKEKIETVGDFYVSIYFKNLREGVFILIDGNQIFKKNLKLSVQKTINNIIPNGTETCFLCENISNKEWYRVTKVVKENEISFIIEMDYNKERKNFMQSYIMFPIGSMFTNKSNK